MKLSLIESSLKDFEDNFEVYFENKIIGNFYVMITIDNRFQGNK